MQAMILCAGRGSRLASARGKTPKPLVAVGGVSLLAGRIAALADAGFSRFVINVLLLSAAGGKSRRASRVGGAASRADSKSVFRAKNRRSKPQAESASLCAAARSIPIRLSSPSTPIFCAISIARVCAIFAPLRIRFSLVLFSSTTRRIVRRAILSCAPTAALRRSKRRRRRRRRKARAR